MIVTGLGGCLQPAATTRRWCQQVHCTPDAVAAPSSSYSAGIERPLSKHQLLTPVSQLSAVQLQDPQAVWPSQQAPLINVVQLRPAQAPAEQWHVQDTLQQRAAAVVAPQTRSSDSGPGRDTGASAGVSAPPKQRSKHRQQRRNQQQQTSPRHKHSLQAPTQQPPISFAPPGKRDGHRLAVPLSQALRKGRRALLPAGAGMQLVRSTALLASTRSMLLSRDSSTGLVFQPSFSTKAAAGALQAGQQQQQQQNAGGSAQQDRVSSSHGASSSSSKGVMLLVSTVPEAQLRRFDQQPLIAARSTRAAALAGAMFARLCRRGFTSVRAAGPEATRLAMLAAAEARNKLLGCGLDLAVVPATDLVDVDSLAGGEGPAAQYVEVEAAEGQEGYGPGEELPLQFVRVTVLHLVRCELQQPWRLLPWPVPAEQQPAARHAQQQQQQQVVVGGVQQQRQQAEAVLAAAGQPNVRQRQQQQQPGQEQPGKQQLQAQQPSVGPWGMPAVLGAAAVALSAQGASASNSSDRPGGQLLVEDLSVTVSSVAAAKQLQAAVVPSDLAETSPSATSGSPSVASAQPQATEHPPAAAGVVGAATAAGLMLPAAGQHTVRRGGRWRAAPGADTTAAGGLLAPEQEGEAGVASSKGGGVSAGQGGGATGSSVVVRQPGGLLLQQHKHHKKSSRQLVAAAQAGSSAVTPGCSSS